VSARVRPGSALELLLSLAQPEMAAESPPLAGPLEPASPSVGPEWSAEDDEVEEAPDHPRRDHKPDRTHPAPGSRLHKPWTPQEDKLLRLLWSDVGADRLAVRLGRSVASVHARAVHHRLPTGQHGLLRIKQAERLWGYSKHTIYAAIEALGLQLKTIPITSPRQLKAKRRCKGMTDEQQQAILAFLAPRRHGESIPRPSHPNRSRQGQWGTGRKPPACVACGGTERRHYAKGLCSRCYNQQTLSANPAVRRRVRRAAAAFLKKRDAQ